MRRHHHHPVREIDRLGDVVGHVDHGLPGLAPHVGQQPLHVVAGERIERGERLVHQQHGRIVGERAGDRDALLHAAREMVRIGLDELVELDELELAARDLLALGLGDPLHLQPEGHVAERGAPGKQLREVLEHDAAIHAVAGDRRAADADLARARPQKPAMMLSSVVLPQPDGPTRQTNSDCSISKLTPSTPATRPAGVS